MTQSLSLSKDLCSLATLFKVLFPIIQWRDTFCRTDGLQCSLERQVGSRSSSPTSKTSSTTTYATSTPTTATICQETRM
ncbi:hypothetical protein BgiBS90_036598 [Biomphalaria glabrata]|nr:hypothetical protein BgiBS90_036598 [Biomphalaria glabrata]